jgi:hypothetical protein
MTTELDDSHWAREKAHFTWDCPICSAPNVGVAELELGRLYGRCTACGHLSLVLLWASDHWLHAPSAGVILAADD